MPIPPSSSKQQNQQPHLRSQRQSKFFRSIKHINPQHMNAFPHLRSPIRHTFRSPFLEKITPFFEQTRLHRKPHTALLCIYSLNLKFDCNLEFILRISATSRLTVILRFSAVFVRANKSE